MEKIPVAWNSQAELSLGQKEAQLHSEGTTELLGQGRGGHGIAQVNTISQSMDKGQPSLILAMRILGKTGDRLSQDPLMSSGLVQLLQPEDSPSSNGDH